MDPLHLTTSSHEDTVTVSVSGELDIATTELLRAHLFDALERAGEVVLEVSGLSFIDAAGLGTLVAIRSRARLLRTRLLLAGTPPPMARLLRITGLDVHFPTMTR
ncbi:STAS domain-containing protein [Nonomuraea sp. LPB2021202275-12-8]|uniref:STAS domain-containing protein n=1 Tax=Nonomuraea sp. LPB2021202275-12-8 TaxID=3120159 RepID=UPI00300D121B